MSLDVILAGWVIGAQIASAHYGSGASEMEAVTPGIYAMHPSGATLSVYRNSQGSTSVLAGWTWQWFDGRAALTVGAVTGYSEGSVLPAVLPSVRLPLGDGWGVRLTLVPPLKSPQITGAAALALERQF
jgi:hypothetical protein